MQNFKKIKLVSPVVVAAHDAGAANLIIGWLSCQSDIEIRTCLAGPAISLWTAAFGKPQNLQPMEALMGAKTLLSGTSYNSKLEHEARTLAIEHKIHSVGIIDHWVNYHSRFLHNGKQILPDEIWVTDKDALDLATIAFPNILVQQKTNDYLASLVEEILSKTIKEPEKITRRVLYALEPLRGEWIVGGKAGEFQALDYFIKNAHYLGLNKKTEIRLRPHPSDSFDKYHVWLAQQASWNLCIDPLVNLAESIAWSDTVAGCETYALVVGLAANRRVVSTLPPNAPRCRLPISGIVHLRDFSASENFEEPL